MRSQVKNRSEKPPKLVENSGDGDNVFKMTRKHSAGCIFHLAVLMYLFFAIFPAAVHSQGSDSPSSGDQTRGLVMVIPVDRVVDKGLAFFITRMIRRAELEHAALLVLEINSNGGLLDPAQEIKDALLRTKIPTLAYIKGRALSAAALIAISCNKIFMEPGSEMGAATPFKILGSGVAAAEEKFVSALQGEFESTAEVRKRPKALAGAMVNKNHNTIDGLVKKGEILTLTTETAFNHGYCDYVATSLESAFRRLSIQPNPLERMEPTSGESLARWLTHPNVSVVLFTIGAWCLILEFITPGVGLLGLSGVICLSLFFGGHMFAYLAGFEAVILFVIGMILLLLEIFVIPGFGITGVSGIIAVSLSIVIVFGGIYTAVYAIAKIIAMSVVMCVALYNIGPKIKLFDRFILKTRMCKEEGYTAVDVSEFDHLLNLEGITVSPCRPAGIIRIGSEKYEVLSDGDFIERNQRVTVIKVEGPKIVVRSLLS